MENSVPTAQLAAGADAVGEDRQRQLEGNVYAKGVSAAAGG